MKTVFLFVPFLVLLGCAPVVQEDAPPAAAAPELSAPAPRVGANTAASLDTTTPEQRAEAAKVDTGSQDRLLGETIVSLGNPTQPGFWIETPLVDRPAKGRVVLPDTGVSVSVELMPIDAAPGSGSRLSLPAMRLLGAPLTGLPTVQVFGP